MKLFHDYTFNWWQLGIFKLSLLSIGVILGAYWSDLFLSNLIYVSVVVIISTLYVLIIALKQTK